LRGLSGFDSRQFLCSLGVVSRVKTGLVGFFGFVTVSLERLPKRRFNWWLCVYLLIFCNDFLFFVVVVVVIIVAIIH
jgi:hypothetical protein